MVLRKHLPNPAASGLAAAVGLWPHRVFHSSRLSPIGETASTMARWLPGDVARWETFDEARAAVLSAGPRVSAAKALAQWEGRFRRGEAPRWLAAWRGYATWLRDLKTASRPDDVRVSFGSPYTGRMCCEGTLRRGRTFFVRRGDGSLLAAVMCAGSDDPAWASWLLIEGAQGALGGPAGERLVIDPRGGCRWVPVSLSLLGELCASGAMCLFEMERDALFDAVTDPALNPNGRLARLSADFLFLRSPSGDLSVRWAATHNPRSAPRSNSNKSLLLTIDSALERGLSWASRPVEVSSPEDAEAVARRVAETDGCALLPKDAQDALRLAVTDALFYVTFPDRRPDEPGGLLMGYQLPGRAVRRADGPLRGDNTALLANRSRLVGRARSDAKRRLVADTLVARAARAVAGRNGLSETEALQLVESAGGRATLEEAARRLGMADGAALARFSPGRGAGSRRLPDLSLALAFEERLGLDGGATAPAAQTAPAKPLAETIGSERHVVSGVFPLQRMWQPGASAAEPLAFRPGSERVVRRGGLYFFMAFPKGAPRIVRERELSCGADDDAEPVSAYWFKSAKGERSREAVELRREVVDWRRLTALAREGRAALYSIDFGILTDLADAAYLTTNSPCRFAASVPKFAGRAAPSPLDDEAKARITFVINPAAPRGVARRGARSLAAYLAEHPDERGRAVVEFDPSDPKRSAMECARRDALLVVRERDDAPAALEAMSYVVLPERGPDDEGGLYAGYMLRDRVFIAEGGGGPLRRGGGRCPQLPAGDIAPEEAARLEARFAGMIAADPALKGSGVPTRLAGLVSREFRRIRFSGSRSRLRQLVRPAREVALAIWLLSL